VTAPARNAFPRPIPTTRPGTRMVRILLIDDDETARHLAKRELDRALDAARVEEVRDADGFARAVDGGAFDLVVTDYQLRWGDGLAVLRAVKARRPDVPVIMFTGSGNEEVAVEAMKAGLDDYVPKSQARAARLAAAARAALDRADARRRAAAAERERADLLARERAARAEAERLLREAKEADRRKDEFLAMLAHELRNPLAPIKNAAYVLLAGGADPAARRAGEIVARQVDHLVRLVDDLLDVSRITRGTVELRTDPVDLTVVAGRAVEATRPLLDARRHRLAFAPPPGPVWVTGDADRLVQVVANLLNNAAKFTPPGGEVRLSVGRVGPAAEVRVADTGVGIPAELLPRVFDLFAQGDRTLARSEGGLGVGLTLVKRLVELHGGAVEARSGGPGRGSEFVVRLPAAGAASAAADEPAADAPAAAGRRVLVVDDNRDAADTLAHLFGAAGYEVRTAYDGPEALTVADDFRPEAAVLDIGLPQMDGYEVARRLRGRFGAGLLLVAVTGYGTEEDRRRAVDAGFDAHFAKPADPIALTRLLAETGTGPHTPTGLRA